MPKLFHMLATAALLCIAAYSGATIQIVTVGSSGNNFSPSSFTINPGDTVTWVWSAGFHNTSATTVPTGAATWYSNITSTSTTFTYVPAVSGLYSYECTFHSGMSGQFTVTGCMAPTKPVITSSNGNTACQGGAIMMSIPVQSGATYQWVNGITAVVGATTQSLNATVSGSYRVNVNRCGIDSISAPFIVAINTSPIPSFTHIHAGLAYTFTNTTSPLTGNSYLWTFGDGSPPLAATNALHTFDSAGIYTVTLKATDSSNTCFASSSSVIQTSLGIGNLKCEEYSILPNPVTSVIQIITTTDATLMLLDLRGHTVMVPVPQTGKHYLIDVSALRSGMYLLYISTRTGFAVDKIMVVH